MKANNSIKNNYFLGNTKIWIVMLAIALGGQALARQPRVVMAAALTYKKHIKETGEKVDPNNPILFVKSQNSLLAADQQQTIRIPTQEQAYDKLEALKPGITDELDERFESFPLLMDYEGELGLYFKRDIPLEEIERDDILVNTVALFAANDISLRSFQVLGDKESNKYSYWAAGKSFDDFLPYSTPVGVNVFQLNSWPNLTVQTYVDGELRQSASPTEIIYTPKQFLRAMATQLGGTIPSNTALITGTPSGTAFKVSKLKRFFANFLGLSPFKKLEVAAKDAAKSGQYLKNGSVVEVKIQGVGSNKIVVRE